MLNVLELQSVRILTSFQLTLRVITPSCVIMCICINLDRYSHYNIQNIYTNAETTTFDWIIITSVQQFCRIASSKLHSKLSVSVRVWFKLSSKVNLISVKIWARCVRFIFLVIQSKNSHSFLCDIAS